MLEPIKPYLQEQAGDAEGGGTGGTDERKRYVESKVEERYNPREVREVLARFGDKAEVALEHVIKEGNDLVRRLMKRQAELEYDLKAAQNEVESERQARKQVESERDQVRATLEERIAQEQQALIDDKLKERFGDDVLVRRHKAYLTMDGYTLELDGDRLMLRQGEKRHNFDTIVNDAWYARYDDARPSGDTPLPSPGTPPSRTGASTFDPKAISDQWGEAARRGRERAQIPGVTHG